MMQHHKTNLLVSKQEDKRQKKFINTAIIANLLYFLHIINAKKMERKKKSLYFLNTMKVTDTTISPHPITYITYTLIDSMKQPMKLNSVALI